MFQAEFEEFLKNVILFNNYVDFQFYDEAVKHLKNIITQHGNLRPLYLSKLFTKLYSNWNKFTIDQQNNILEILGPSMQKAYCLKTILRDYQQDISFCAKVIQKNIANITKEMFHYIIGNENLIQALKYSLQEEYSISQQLPKNLLQNLIDYAIDYNEFRFLEFIENLDQKLFNEITQSFSAAKQNKLQKIVSTKSSMLSKYTREFVEGFGNVSYEGGLLTCAQIAENKTYNFDPVVFKDIDEFKDFIHFIAQDINYFKDKSLKFVISGSHWISGMIEFDKEGKMKILLMDSMGHEKAADVVNINYEVSEVIKIIQSNIGNDVKIYCPSETRQNSMKGCSIFALDDLRRFYTIQENLPKKYSSLFDFYEQNATEQQGQLFNTEGSESIMFLDCNLPAHFKKTKQSSKLIQEIKGDKEFRNLPNKHGKTPLDSIAISFKNIEEKQVNKKLNSKLDKHAERNIKFLYNHNDQDTKKTMNSFSFEGFKKRVSHEKQVSKVDSGKISTVEDITFIHMGKRRR